MASKNGLISVGLGIIGIILLFIPIIPFTALETAGWGGSPNWTLFFSIDLIFGILTVGLGVYGRNRDESKTASTTGLIIGFILIFALILVFLWHIM